MTRACDTLDPTMSGYRSPAWSSRPVAASAPTTCTAGCCKDNIIFLQTPIDDTVASLICAQLIHLESENPDKDINIYINSPGGDITALFAIYDTMQFIKNDIATICLGQAASAAAVLLAAGTKGKRLALPHSRILLHQPYGQVGYGQVTDLELAAKEILRMRDLLEEILALHTGQTIERVHADTDRDFVMEATEALAYGIIDDVLRRRAECRPHRSHPLITATRGGITAWRNSVTPASC